MYNQATYRSWFFSGRALNIRILLFFPRLQFHNFRHGDRFWYENGGWPSSFTLEQLDEIRKVKLSRILCDNTDDLESMQVFAMVLPDHEINPRVPCKSGVLPRLDLTKWKDASYHSSPSGGK